MPDFKEQFETYGGDYAATMARFMGKEALYLKFLGMLPQDKSLEKLDGALQAGDLAAAFEAAHTLKGVAANLGLTPLCRAVCDIVEPLRAGEQLDYAPLYQAVRAEFQKVDLLCKNLKKES